MMKGLLALALLLALAASAHAGMTFGAATSDRLDCGSGATIDNLTTYTWTAWVRATTLTDGRQMLSKNDGSGVAEKGFSLNGAGGDTRQRVGYNTTDSNFITNTTPLSSAVWKFLAWTFDSGATPQTAVWVGDERAAVAAATFGTSTAGSTTINSDAAINFLIGNNGALTLAFQGDIGPVTVHNAVLTEAQINTVRAQTMNAPSAVMVIPVGYNATATHTDWTGTGNNCTVTGATRTGDPQIPLANLQW